MYRGTSLRQTPLGPTKSSIIERVSSGQGFIIHYVGKGLSSREAARGHATNVDGIVLSVTINRLYNY